MPNRIIDQTERTTIVGTESIVGTEQTSIGDTVPKNVRWTWNTVISWIYSIMGKHNIQKFSFNSAGNKTYTAERYESVFRYVMISASGTKVKMGVLANPELFLPETESEAGIINQFFTSSNSVARQVRIEVDAAATVYLFVTKNLIP